MPDFNNIALQQVAIFSVERPDLALWLVNFLGAKDGDGSAPDVVIVGPAAGTPVDALTPLVLEVTDDIALGMLIIAARFPTRGIEEVVHNGQRFAAQYDGASSRVAVAAGFRFTILRNGGWVDAPTIDVYAVDAAGTEA